MRKEGCTSFADTFFYGLLAGWNWTPHQTPRHLVDCLTGRWFTRLAEIELDLLVEITSAHLAVQSWRPLHSAKKQTAATWDLESSIFEARVLMPSAWAKDPKNITSMLKPRDLSRKFLRRGDWTVLGTEQNLVVYLYQYWMIVTDAFQAWPCLWCYYIPILN